MPSWRDADAYPAGHYERHYMDGMFAATLGLSSQPYERETVPFMYRMNSVDPPRLEANPDAMAGYRAARGEFDVPYDNSAESLVSHLDVGRRRMSDGDDDEDGEENGDGSDGRRNWDEASEMLRCGVVLAYNNRLR